MANETRLVESLSDAERETLFRWGSDIFGTAALPLQWRKKEQHILVYAGGRLVSHVGILKHLIYLLERPVILGGVGGLVTVPEAQGNGYASAAMRIAQAYLYQEIKADFGLLFCLDSLIPFYARLGWQITPGPVLVDQAAGKITIPLNVMVLPCSGHPWPDGLVDLDSLPW